MLNNIKQSLIRHKQVIGIAIVAASISLLVVQGVSNYALAIELPPGVVTGHPCSTAPQAGGTGDPHTGGTGNPAGMECTGDPHQELDNPDMGNPHNSGNTCGLPDCG
jgi:hypothetical protein